MSIETLQNKHEQAETELSQIHVSVGDALDLLEATRKKLTGLEETTDGSIASDSTVGRLRREIKRIEKGVTELQRQHCKLADQELTARYALRQAEVEQVEANQRELREQKISLEHQLAVARDRLAKAEAHAHELAEKARRMKHGTLQRHLEHEAKDAITAANKTRKEIEELNKALAEAEKAIAHSQQRAESLNKELERLLALGETHCRWLDGSPEKIRETLADPHIPVNRAQVEEVLAKWEAGLSTTVKMPGIAARTIDYRVQDGAIFYWADTGDVCGQVIFDARTSPAGLRWPGSIDRTIFWFKGTVENLEAQRDGRPLPHIPVDQQSQAEASQTEAKAEA